MDDACIALCSDIHRSCMLRVHACMHMHMHPLMMRPVVRVLYCKLNKFKFIKSLYIFHATSGQVLVYLPAALSKGVVDITSEMQVHRKCMMLLHASIIDLCYPT
jgi:hypothetical protein